MVMPANVTAAAIFGGVPLLALASQASRAAPALALASRARAAAAAAIFGGVPPLLALASQASRAALALALASRARAASPTDSQGKKRGRSAKVMPIEAQLNDSISH